MKKLFAMKKIGFIVLMMTCFSTLSLDAQTTDISTRSEALYIENATCNPNEQVLLSVNIKNDNVLVRGFQFDLYLPEGVTVATDEDGFPLVDLSTARTTPRKMNFFDSAIQTDGALRVLCNSTGAHYFDGTSGEVCTIMVNVAREIRSGAKDLEVKNVVFTDPDAKKYDVADVTSTLTVNGSGIWGDLNNDGVVSVSDVTMLVNYILNPRLSLKINK